MQSSHGYAAEHKSTAISFTFSLGTPAKARNRVVSMVVQIVPSVNTEHMPTSLPMLGVCMQVCMVLRFVAEEVMVYADDLGQASKRALLAGQQAALPVVLPTLTQLLERHYGAALAAAQASQPAEAQAHAAAVTAGLGAQQYVKNSDVVAVLICVTVDARAHGPGQH